METSMEEMDTMLVSRENKVSIVWKITNFSSYTKVGQKLQSRSFSIFYDQCIVDEWYLVCYPNGNNEEYSGFVGVFLCSNNKFRTSFELSFELKNHPVVKGNINLDTKGASVGQPKYVERQFLRMHMENYLPKDTLSILCRIEIKENVIPRIIKKKVANKWALSSDLEGLLGSTETSDFEILVGSTTFPVHKSILSARSPYFKAMFSHKMIENTENKVRFEDMEEDVAGEMIKFIYSGSVSNLAKLADRLLIAAEKYGLEDLKELCELQMIENLAKDNACLFLSIAHQYGLAELKSASLEFISQGIDSVKDTPGFYEINTSNPTLFMELFQFYVSKNKKNQ